MDFNSSKFRVRYIVFHRSYLFGIPNSFALGNIRRLLLTLFIMENPEAEALAHLLEEHEESAGIPKNRQITADNMQNNLTEILGLFG